MCIKKILVKLSDGIACQVCYGILDVCFWVNVKSCMLIVLWPRGCHKQHGYAA